MLHRSLLTLIALTLLAPMSFAQTLPTTRRTAAAAPMPADPSLPTLWIIGDSTVHNHDHLLVGWGDIIHEYFDTTRINVVNRALGGRSSRTFLTEGHWDDALKSMKSGDYLLMQFGHNDESPVNEKPDSDPKMMRSRGTIHGIGDETQDITNVITHQPETVHTFGYYMRRFVSEAKAKGVNAIVCAYVPRAPRNQTPATQPMNHALWAKQIADEQHVPFIDLRAVVSTYYSQFPPEKTKALFFPSDGTHTNAAGAHINAAAVTLGLKSLPNCPLATYILPDAPKDLNTLTPTTAPATN